MDIKELEKELQQALSHYGHDVQHFLTENETLLSNEEHRQLLNIIDKMNDQNYKTLDAFKDSLIKYLEANK